MFDDLERSIASLSTDNDLSSAATTVATIRVCIFHIIAAYETSVSTSPLLRGASTAVSDAVSLRTLLHPLLPDTWRIVGRQLTDTLYCVVRRDNWRNGNNNNHSSSGGGGGGGGISSSSSSSNSNSTTVGGNAPAGSENWLAYIEERWQNLSASTVPDTGAMFSGKNAIVLSCPVAPLIISSAADNVVFHEAATRALYRVYEQAQAKTLYPYLVLLGGKALKTVLRKSLARHLFDLGFGEYRVHWHGLSSKADAAFVGDITRLWQSLATQSEQL